MEERDELIERAASTLRRRTAPNPRVVARVMAAVDGRPRRWWRSVGWPPAPVSLGAAMLAAAALLISVVSRPSGQASSEAQQLARSNGVSSGALQLVPVSRSSNAEQRIPVQFTLRDVQAQQVALVGDFNDWSQTAMLLEPGSVAGTWSLTVPLAAGRHVYAFVVDGKTWMPDPRAVQSRDLDFGRANSVLIVQAP